MEWMDSDRRDLSLLSVHRRRLTRAFVRLAVAAGRFAESSRSAHAAAQRDYLRHRAAAQRSASLPSGDLAYSRCAAAHRGRVPGGSADYALLADEHTHRVDYGAPAGILGADAIRAGSRLRSSDSRHSAPRSLR